MFDTIIGYESSNAGDNPNYSRSWGYTIEPTQHTGILGTYRFCDAVAASFGVANTWNAPINGRVVNNTDSTKTYMASVALTAPESFGFLHGGSLYAGIVSGKQGAAAGSSVRSSYYLGATVPTPIEGLKAGVAFDYVVTVCDQAHEACPLFPGSTRVVLEEVVGMVDGVTHVEVDAESHLDLVRRLDVRRTPTVLVLDSTGLVRVRAAGAPRKADVIAALGQVV